MSGASRWSASQAVVTSQRLAGGRDSSAMASSFKGSTWRTIERFAHQVQAAGAQRNWWAASRAHYEPRMLMVRARFKIPIYTRADQRQNARRVVVENDSYGGTPPCVFYAIKECCEIILARGVIFSKARRRPAPWRQGPICSRRVQPRPTIAPRRKAAAGRAGATSSATAP